VLVHSLALVGDVPEFREGRSRLAALEDRLQRRVEGRLADALQVRLTCRDDFNMNQLFLNCVHCGVAACCVSFTAKPPPGCSGAWKGACQGEASMPPPDDGRRSETGCSCVTASCTSTPLHMNCCCSL
jgi:hypothetical protein